MYESRNSYSELPVRFRESSGRSGRSGAAGESDLGPSETLGGQRIYSTYNHHTMFVLGGAKTRKAKCIKAGPR